MLSGKEKLPPDGLSKLNKGCYDQKMEDYWQTQGGKQERGPGLSLQNLSILCVLCRILLWDEIHQSGIFPGELAKDLGEMWHSQDTEKWPHVTKAKRSEKDYWMV